MATGTPSATTLIYSYSHRLHVSRMQMIFGFITDITEGERRKAERVINTHRKEAKEAEAHAKAMLTKVEEQKHEISALREQLKMLHHTMKPSPATRSSSQHTLDGKHSSTSTIIRRIIIFISVIPPMTVSFYQREGMYIASNCQYR